MPAVSANRKLARQETVAEEKTMSRTLIKLGLPAALLLLAFLASPAAAEPPANDARAAATVLSPPGGTDGTTAGATLESDESPQIDGAGVAGSVWYTFRTAQARRVVVRL